MSDYTFEKDERLSSRKLIDALFMEGDSLISHPFRLVWKIEEVVDENYLQVAISVPKKRVPKAAHRNRIRRLVKEGFRKQKEGLKKQLKKEQKKLTLMIICLDKQAGDYQDLENKIIVNLERLEKEICVN
tara:strand:+ start:1318 stop:1707 length:390 start_codon:yes stop_codon:yes gene_type:complete